MNLGTLPGIVQRQGVANTPVTRQPLFEGALVRSDATDHPAFFGLNDFAFVSAQSGRPAVWRCNLSGGTVTLLVESSQACHSPSVATERQMLLYFQQTERQTFHVYQCDADGETCQLTNAQEEGSAALPALWAYTAACVQLW